MNHNHAPQSVIILYKKIIIICTIHMKLVIIIINHSLRQL